MELRQLEYFREVARLGSFSQAAAVLAVAQPALSRQVRKLEQELGSDLLYRHGRGVVLTEAGGRFLQGIAEVLDRLESLRGAVAAEREVPRGVVTLGMPPSLSSVVGAPLLQRLRARWPELHLRISDGFSGYVNEWLMSGRIDLAVLHRGHHAGSIVTDPLLQEDLYLLTAARPGDTATPLPFAELAGRDLILPGQHHGLRRELDRVAAETGTPLRVMMEVDALAAIRDLVLDGTADAVLPYGCVWQDIAAGRITARRLCDPAVVNELVLGMSARRPVRLAMREVVRALRAEITALLADGRLAGEERQAEQAPTPTGPDAEPP